MTSTIKFAMALATTILSSAAAHATVVYQNDFQGSVGNEWSNTLTSNTPTPYPTGPRSFLGEFSNQTVNLNLAAVPVHDMVTVSFDLYLIRSWDGSSTGTTYDWGNDYFSFGVNNGPTLLHDTFSNGNPAGQTYGPNAINPWGTGAAEIYSLGYIFNDGTINQDENSVYHFSYSFASTEALLGFNFTGSGLQTIDDESWGIDNVMVSVSAVPEPATMPLFAAGLGLIGFMVKRSRRA
jgi:hypothetical protein